MSSNYFYHLKPSEALAIWNQTFSGKIFNFLQKFSRLQLQNVKKFRNSKMHFFVILRRPALKRNKLKSNTTNGIPLSYATAKLSATRLHLISALRCYIRDMLLFVLNSEKKHPPLRRKRKVGGRNDNA